MNKPRLLDLYCGAGGIAKGYMDAGFYVVGVDIEPQPHYIGDAFIQADALTFPLDGYDAYHASPVCKGYSIATLFHGHKAREQHPHEIAAIRERLLATGKHYVIENVPEARHDMRSPIMLCGTMFDLQVVRHRLFESNVYLYQPAHPEKCRRHRIKVAKPGAIARDGEYWCIGGHMGQKDRAQRAMGIDWMMTQAEISQAVPHAYSHWIGCQLLALLEREVQS